MKSVPQTLSHFKAFPKKNMKVAILELHFIPEYYSELFWSWNIKLNLNLNKTK